MAAAIPFAMKAAPYAAMGLGALFGKKASQPSALQRQAVTQTQQGGQAVSALAPPTLQAGKTLTQQGTGYLGQGASELAPAASYYRNVLGSRSAANTALSPERNTALEYYGGAQRKLQRTMRGPARESAIAELDRQKAGQLASYLPQARQAGAQGLERVGSLYGGMGAQALGAGTSLTGQGLNAAAQGAYLGSGLFNQASQLRDQERQGGQAWGNILYDLAGSLFGMGGKKPLASGRLPISPLYTGPRA